MLRLAMFQPNAMLQSVLRLLPEEARSFNWFFFGTRVFDPRSGRHLLVAPRTTQFLDRARGTTYEVTEPAGVAFLLTDAETLTGAELRACHEYGYAGYAHRRKRKDGAPPLVRPPLSPHVEFVVLRAGHAGLAPVTEWKRIRLLNYASREPQFGPVPSLVEALGVAGATKYAAAELTH